MIHQLDLRFSLYHEIIQTCQCGSAVPTENPAEDRRARWRRIDFQRFEPSNKAWYRQTGCLNPQLNPTAKPTDAGPGGGENILQKIMEFLQTRPNAIGTKPTNLLLSAAQSGL